VKIIAFVIALGLFVFGIVLMGYAFEPDGPTESLFSSVGSRRRGVTRHPVPLLKAR
jgi:hypothetical protein